MNVFSYNLPIAAIDLDTIIGVIIFISIIGRLIGSKNKKNTDSTTDETSVPGKTGNVSDAQEELQAFLNTLAGIPQEPKPVPPPPPVPIQTPPAKQKQIQVETTSSLQQSRPVVPAQKMHIVRPSAQPPVRHAVPTTRKHSVAPPLPPIPRSATAVRAARKTLDKYDVKEHSGSATLLRRDISDKSSLRKFIVLKEILDKPLALR